MEKMGRIWDEGNECILGPEEWVHGERKRKDEETWREAGNMIVCEV